MEEPCEDKYTLKWREFSTTVTSGVESLLEDSEFVDVTLSCDGQSFSAHKVMLAASSRYFRTVLKNNPCQHPIIILRDVKPNVMRSLIEYVYCGVVTISEQDLGELLRVGEMLEFKGLSGDEQIDSHAQKFVETQMDARKSPEPPPPPRKRKKLSDSPSTSISAPSTTNGPTGFLAVNNVRSLRDESSVSPSDFNESSNLSVGNSPTESALEPKSVIKKKTNPSPPETAFSLVTPKTEPPDDEVEEGGLTAPGPSGISQQGIQESSDDPKSSSFPGGSLLSGMLQDHHSHRKQEDRHSIGDGDSDYKKYVLKTDRYNSMCKICNRVFIGESSRTNCKAHVEAMHFPKPKNEWDICSYCQKPFATRGRLLSHLNTVHGVRQRISQPQQTIVLVDSAPTHDVDLQLN